jgi:Fic family protein
MKEVVARTGIDQSLISKFEKGSRIPTDEQVGLLAACYGVDYGSLKKLQLAERVYELVRDESYGQEALLAAETRLQYFTKRQIQDQFQISDSTQVLLDRLDDLQRQYVLLAGAESTTHTSKVREHFALSYTYESNKIEGNTLTLSETMMVVKEGITISGKSVNEHLEAINHSEAISLMYDLVGQRAYFDRRLLLDLHALVLRGIDRDNAGRYRKVNVRILGAAHIPPDALLVQDLMHDYFMFFEQYGRSGHPVIIAAEMHERLVTIHPFIDGNGRTSRLVMNLILLMHGYPIAVLKGDQPSRLAYFDALERVQVDGDPEAFHQLVINRLIASLEEHIDLLTPVAP